MFVLLTLLVMLSCGCVFAQPLQGSVSAVDESMRPGAVYAPVRSRVEFYRIPAAFAGAFQTDNTTNHFAWGNKVVVSHSTTAHGVQDIDGKIYDVIDTTPQVIVEGSETRYIINKRTDLQIVQKYRIRKYCEDTVLVTSTKTHKIKRTLQMSSLLDSRLQADGSIYSECNESNLYDADGKFIRAQTPYSFTSYKIAPYVRDDRYDAAFTDWMQTKGAR